MEAVYHRSIPFDKKNLSQRVRLKINFVLFLYVSFLSFFLFFTQIDNFD